MTESSNNQGTEAHSRTRLRTSWLRVAWPYLVLVVLAFAVRAWSLLFSEGSPRARADEEIFAIVGLKLFSPDKNPHHGHVGWPDLFFFMVHGAQWIFEALLRFRTGAPLNLGCLYAEDPIRITQLGRFISLVLGTATVLVTAAVARRMVPDSAPARHRAAAGLLGGLFLAFDFLHARDSHFGVSDTTLLFMLTVSLWGLMRVLERGELKDWLLAGAFAGLACSVKYTALAFLPTCLFAAIWRVALPGPRRRAVAGVGLAVVAAAAAFSITSPHVFVEPATWYAGLLTHQHRFNATAGVIYDYEIPPSTDLGLRRHFMLTLPTALGWPLFAVALAGLALALVRPSGKRMTTAFFVLSFFFVVLAPSRTLFHRYTLPIHPGLCALAGVAVAAFSERLRGLLPAALGRWAAPALGILLVLQPAARIARLNALLGRPDTRDLAREWLLAHSRPGQTLVTQGGYAQVHALEAAAVAACDAALPAALRRPVPLLVSTGLTYEDLVGKGRSAWGELAHRATYAYVDRDHPDPDWVLQSVPLHRCGKRGRSDGLRSLSSCFEVAAVISPGKAGCDAVYDTFDSFFGPVANFAGVHHFGPEITIYRNRCKHERTATSP